MRITRILTLILAAALLALVAVGCKGGGGSGDTTSGSGDKPVDLVSADPLAVLSASAESFQADVQSFQARLEMTMDASIFSMDINGDIAFQAPDQIHMTMEIGGEGLTLEMQMLILGDQFYVQLPFFGWAVFSPEDIGLEDLGFESEMFEDLMENRSLLDYEELIASLGGEIEDLGDEEIDGRTYRHYRGSLSFADAMAVFNDAFGTMEELGDVDGAMDFDIWVDVETVLPHRMTASGDLVAEGETVTFDMTISFFGYNEPVEIPAPPADATPLMDLLRGLEDFEFELTE